MKQHGLERKFLPSDINQQLVDESFPSLIK